jgi:uncharacterized protein (TIGR02145 family)
MKLSINKSLIINLLFLFAVIMQISGCSKESNVEPSVPNAPNQPKVPEETLPNAPSELIRTPWNSSGKEVSLRWKDNSDNETGFKLERKTNSGSFVGIQTCNSVNLECKDEGLSINTTYTYRLCSYNKIGNSKTYSNEVTVSTDIDGNAYTEVKIGNQIWMKENLAVSKYRNGNLIPKMEDAQNVLTPKGYLAWSNLTDSKFGACIYLTSGEFPNGKYYNWYAVNDSRGLAPKGWHIPTRAEWKVLSNFLGGELVAGGKMKKVETPGFSSAGSSWSSPNTGATDISGFTALPGGVFRFNGTAQGSSFFGNKTLAYFWSSNEFDLTQAYTYKLSNTHEKLIESYVTDYKVQGGNVRCIKD